MKQFRVVSRGVLFFVLAGAIGFGYPQGGKNDEKQGKQEQQARPARQQQGKQEQQARPAQQQQPQRAQQQQQQARPAQQQQPQRAQQQQQAQQQHYSVPQRSHQQAQAWQQQRGWAQQGAWQGQNNWQQTRARSWSSDHRTWSQRGGYGGFYIPQASFGLYFGSQHYFRLRSRPVLYMGYPRFQYGGYSFLMVDPWPEYWDDSWYDSDDLYIDYNDGYYLYNRRYPQYGVAVTIVL